MPTPPRRARDASSRKPPPRRDGARSGPSARTGAAPAKRSRALIGIVGSATVVALVLLLLLWKNLSNDDPSPGTGAATAGGAAAPEAAASQDPGAARAAAGGSAPPPPAAPPKLDPAALEQQLASTTTAAAAVQLGDDAKKVLGDPALADRCWQKALDLDPTDKDARQRLDVKPFEPRDHLPGFDDLFGTRVTWRMAAFNALRGREMTRPQREAEAAKWAAPRQEIEARLARGDQERFIAELDGTVHRLHDQPFFKDLQFELVESTAPYALIVEVEGDAAARKKRRDDVEKAYTSFLVAYDKKIHSYLFPLSPRPPEKSPTFITYVLLNEPSYQRYHREALGDAGGGPPGVRAHYEPQNRRSITWSPILDPRNPQFAEGCQTLLHELTHAWVDQLATMDGGQSYSIRVVQTHWFSEGIAEYMSCHFLERDGSIRFQPWRSMRVSEASRRQFRIPFKDALRIQNSGQLHGWAASIAQDHKQGGGDPKRIETTVSSGFYADMALFIFWLNHADDGASRERFSTYASEELKGDGGTEAFDRLFSAVLDGRNLDQTIDEFAKRVATGAETFRPDQD